MKNKKWIRSVFATGIMMFSLAGCGTQAVENPSTETDAAVNEEQAEPETTEGETEQEDKDAGNTNMESEQDKAIAFAEQIKTTVADKDLEALSDLCFYPVAVNGEVVSDRDAFIALGQDVIFTEERCAVIAAVDTSAMTSTKAGVIMGESTPNIIFKGVDGELGISGIN